ncbi:MAG: hypothetical protein IJY21_03465 [Clostridia bacterium]|nr:hypothetical protein [Clostridia bacterium]
MSSDMVCLVFEFQEEYKRLDRLCKETYSSANGVTEYINQMERHWYKYQRCVDEWEEDYKELKHVRWVRNQLAHEVGALEMGICTSEDLIYVKDFHQRILKSEDPLALGRKAVEEENRHKYTIKECQRTNKQKENPSFIKKIFAKIKRFFMGE